MKWQTKTIGEFCRTGSGGTPSRQQENKYYGGEIPWVKSGELRESVITETEETITEIALKETSTKLIPAGALLVAMYGATVGRIAILGIEATSNQAVCHIIPDKSIADQRYMFYALQKQVPKWLEQRVGGAQPNISQQIIRDTKIPLPPIAEQRRIAAILDRADAIRRKRQQAIALTEELLRSAFLEMFGDPVTNPRGWKVVALETTFKRKPQIGTAKPAHSDGEQLVIRVGEIGSQNVQLEECGRITLEGYDLEKNLCEPGDFLLARAIGSEAHLGKASILQNTDQLVVFDSHVMRLRFLPELLSPTFFLQWLKTKGGRTRFMREAGRTAVQFNVNATQIARVQIPLPPIELQQEFVQFHQKSLQCLKEHHNSNEVTTSLFNSLLQRAFRGEL